MSKNLELDGWKFTLKKRKSQDPPFFKVYMRAYKKEIVEKYKPGSASYEKYVPQSEWSRYGFDINMTWEDAQVVRDRENSKIKLKEDKERRTRVEDLRYKREKKLNMTSLLPEKWVSEFKDRECEDIRNETAKKKFLSHWVSVSEMIFYLKISPSQYEDNKKKFYNYFIEKVWSMSHVTKLIIVLNKWGKFVSKKEKTYFSELPHPKGKQREDINDNYYDACKPSKESNPLDSEELKYSKDKWKNQDHYNWLFVSLWFGLRPAEVDRLLEDEGKRWKLTTESGKKVLNIYQTKLSSVSRNKRWKKIPILFDEQKESLFLIKSKRLKRPLPKTIQNHFGEGYNTYAGRKGFEALMTDLDVPFEMISSYLGHLNIDRTWKNYKSDKVMIPKELKKRRAI
jgi:hypothetical protein